MEEKYITESPQQLAVLAVLDEADGWISQPDLLEQFRALNANKSIEFKVTENRKNFSSLLQKLYVKKLIKKKQIVEEESNKIPTNMWRLVK